MTSKRLRSILCILSALAALALPTTARADGPRLQLTFDGSLLSYRRTKESFEEPVNDNLVGGPTRRVETHGAATSFGLLGSGVGVGAGYLLTPHWLIGLRGQLTYGTSSNDHSTDEDHKTELGVLPRVEYMFGRATVRPYLAALAGVQRSASREKRLGESTERSGTFFEAGGSFGIRCFLLESLSLDPAFTFTGYTGSLKTTSSLNRTTAVDSDVSGLRVVLSLGLSGWL